MDLPLGDRMKVYESYEAGRRFMPMLPVIARIDGRNFSSFTRSMDRPYDERMIECMVETTKKLVDETAALVGYTQSDEISLLWYSSDPKSQIYFDGRVFKILSVTAAMTTNIFCQVARKYWNTKSVSFDCRAFQVPTRDEAANVFLWRELDATKNAISMAARCHMSHREMHGKNGDQLQELMFQKGGINFNDYPPYFKRGTFVLRRKVFKELPPEILAKIPAHQRPDGPVERQVIQTVEMPRFSAVSNRVGVLFSNEEPITDTDRASENSRP